MTAAKQNVTENGTEQHKAPFGLKLLVVGLGIAIVIMLGLIIFKVIAGDHKKTKKTELPLQQVSEAQPQISRVIESVTGINFNLTMKRPAGSDLISASTTATEIILHFKSAQADTIVVVNRKTGKESRLTVSK